MDHTEVLETLEIFDAVDRAHAHVRQRQAAARAGRRRAG
jgi:hypothetical protein